MPNWPIRDAPRLPCSRHRRRACRGKPWCRNGRSCRAPRPGLRGLMPTPLSEKVSVLASGSIAIVDRERSAVLDQFGLGDRLVAQLLAGVGGVGDEFADEDVAVGIDRMHHEMQQARNVGLEALGPGFGGRGAGVGGQCSGLARRVAEPRIAGGRLRYRRLAARIQDLPGPLQSATDVATSLRVYESHSAGTFKACASLAIVSEVPLRRPFSRSDR